jgi:hypothetical protein
METATSAELTSGLHTASKANTAPAQIGATEDRIPMTEPCLPALLWLESQDFTGRRML